MTWMIGVYITQSSITRASRKPTWSDSLLLHRESRAIKSTARRSDETKTNEIISLYFVPCRPCAASRLVLNYRVNRVDMEELLLTTSCLLSRCCRWSASSATTAATSTCARTRTSRSCPAAARRTRRRCGCAPRPAAAPPTTRPRSSTTWWTRCSERAWDSRCRTCRWVLAYTRNTF